ncbi:MAG: hypothetical protein Ta2A_12130 [Treponemataceae bacterium]|nr:MAG: hypothetical protein Ta2A_12130 [Treponemataceae bacterium]
MAQKEEMMKSTAEYNHGETTCYDSEQKVMCRFVRARRFGTIWECSLFLDREGFNTELWNDENFCLLRCDACKGDKNDIGKS